MKTLKTFLPVILTASILAIFLCGCYTVVLWSTDNDDASSSPSGESAGNNSSDPYYNSDCLSCHSQAELDDRYYDLNHSGISVVHGTTIDPYGWRSPIESVPWWVPDSPAPVAAISITGSSSGSSSAPAPNPSRRRRDGAMRNDTQGPQQGTIDSPTPPTPPPAISVTPAPSTPPPPTGNARPTPSNGGQPRSSGSTRGDGRKN